MAASVHNQLTKAERQRFNENMLQRRVLAPTNPRKMLQLAISTAKKKLNKSHTFSHTKPWNLLTPCCQPSLGTYISNLISVVQMTVKPPTTQHYVIFWRFSFFENAWKQFQKVRLDVPIILSLNNDKRHFGGENDWNAEANKFCSFTLGKYAKRSALMHW